MKIFKFGTSCLPAVTMFLLSFVGFVEEANAGVILHLDTVGNTATLVGSATANEGIYHAFVGRGPQFGSVSGANVRIAGLFGIESDTIQHSHMSVFSGGGISFTSQSDGSPNLGVLLTGNGIARTITTVQKNALLAFNGQVFTGLGTSDTLTVTTAPIAAVPEPSSLLVFGLIGLGACGWSRRRRKQNS